MCFRTFSAGEGGLCRRSDNKYYEKVSSYPEQSAARLMQQELVAVPSFWKVGDIIKHIQNSKLIPDEFYEIYVVNPKHKILGSVHLSKIIRSQQSTPLKSVMWYWPLATRFN